ncbi:hypothetical protein NM208_g12241 [Fusarium decemcellulare]|uniref:Uncharacterized protein n=1 Tax=Fusarium decemcellulare TaxID=57161 RepID=A0ACC1RR78_9HYPO|nr:hypothetical protein NM208_g12241 [Fusarium decemcellulare]
MASPNEKANDDKIVGAPLGAVSNSYRLKSKLVAQHLGQIGMGKIPKLLKYLLSKGRDADAIEAVNYIARYNGKPETLTLDMLQAIDAYGMYYMQILKESFKDYNASSYKKLFGRKMT